MKRYFLLLGMLLAVATGYAETLEKDSVKPKKSFGEKLLTPFKWIGRNWSAYDPQYSVPSFYNWAVQLQNTSTFEWVNLDTPQGMQLDMRSKVSHRLGPYLGYQFLFYGYTIDLNSIGRSTKRKNEFTLSINSNLVNIDIIRRRTGGDFLIRKLNYSNPDFGVLDFTDWMGDDLGDFFRNSLTGVNVNYFVNHKKYSNPAAFSNGAVQLRSVGSPIVGLGYTRQKVECDMTDFFSAFGALFAYDNDGNSIIDDDGIDELDQLYETDRNAYYRKISSILDQSWSSISNDQFTYGLLLNRIPTITTIDDWHLQLGYAYNLVFSRRLLLGMSAILSPSLKRVVSNNSGSLADFLADDLSAMVLKHEGRYVSPDEYRYRYDDTHFNLNTFIRASLTFNFNRWRAGVNASFSNYFYKNGDMKVNNGFGSVCAYVGYCFGRKKEYRHNGRLRQNYIMAALTPKQIEEMHDTLPAGNLNMGQSYAREMGKTRYYHRDKFDLDIEGCDLVRGPEGKFGWYEIQDGYVTPKQDTEGRLKEGTIVDVDENGIFNIEAGHNGNFRTGNWWKSQLKVSQTPDNWYPEMLHYALRGKLTLYLRGRIFGTKKPVKMELEDFCVNHGRETQNFSQMGIKSFHSKSVRSIEGRATVNGRECRVYIEQKKRGKNTVFYVSRVHPATAEWMSYVDGQRPVSTLSIPGTHDAGSASLSASAVVNTAHTQNFSVVDQLYDGIRAFDIRLKKDLRFGHMFAARESFDSTMVEWDRFLTEHPSEVIIVVVGIDGGGKWPAELLKNYQALINKYPHRFVQDFNARTKMDDVRGKILVIRRQEDCPFGKLLKFTDNAVFDYDCFHVEDVYKEHKTWKKAKIVEKNIREAFENDNPDKWYITFNSVAWSPRRHIPYAYAWGGKAKNIRKPLNKALRETVELKDYANFGMVFLDFYNDHGEHPQLVETIIQSNFHLDD